MFEGFEGKCTLEARVLNDEYQYILREQIFEVFINNSESNIVRGAYCLFIQV